MVRTKEFRLGINMLPQEYFKYYTNTLNISKIVTMIKAKQTYLISETEKYVWYAKVKENVFPSALLFLMREVSIRSPPGPSATLRRYSKLQYKIHINTHGSVFAFYCNKVANK
jgi:hypothetical protein